jgi:uncharacterized membrane protein YkoI
MESSLKPHSDSQAAKRFRSRTSQRLCLAYLCAMLGWVAVAPLPLAAGLDPLPIKIVEASPGLLAKAGIPAGGAFHLADMQVPGGMVVAGSIMDDEAGRLVYVFDIKVPGALGAQQVSIDAVTGSLVRTRHADMPGDWKPADLAAFNARVQVMESEPGLLARARCSRNAAFSKIDILVPGGRVVSARLHREGRNLLYAFEVRVEDKQGIEAIGLSAKTGRLLHWNHLSPAEYALKSQQAPGTTAQAP